MEQIEMNARKIPYIYQSEYYSLAWGKKHRGFYVLPNGDKYVYNNPKSFNFYKIEGGNEFDTAWGDETNLTIAPELLFENLEKCTKKQGWLSFFRSKTLLKQQVLNELLKSNVTSYGQILCDAGILSNSLLIYDDELQLYKRILLTARGDRKALNQSKYKSDVVWKYGTTR
jgi:hypothetical protein